MPQGTIKTYDERTKSGVLLDDHATEYGYDEAAFRHSGIRGFRMGQRVIFDLQGDRVVNLSILTMRR